MKKIMLLVLSILIIFTEAAWGNYYEKGLDAQRKDDYRTAYQEWLVGAENGDSACMNALGVLYEQGKGIAQDDNAAFRWYKKAADLGHAEGQYNVGRFYKAERGGIGRLETHMYLHYWDKSAAQDYLPAIVDFGIAAEELGLPSYAIVRYQQATDLGDSFAQERLRAMESSIELDVVSIISGTLRYPDFFMLLLDKYCKGKQVTIKGQVKVAKESDGKHSIIVYAGNPSHRPDFSAMCNLSGDMQGAYYKEGDIVRLKGRYEEMQPDDKGMILSGCEVVEHKSNFRGYPLFPASLEGKEGSFEREIFQTGLTWEHISYPGIQFRLLGNGEEGAQVQWLDQKSFLRALGIQEGDIIHSINGMALSSQQNIDSVLNSLQKSDRIELTLTRDETDGVLKYEVR